MGKLGTSLPAGDKGETRCRPNGRSITQTPLTERMQSGGRAQRRQDDGEISMTTFLYFFCDILLLFIMHLIFSESLSLPVFFSHLSFSFFNSFCSFVYFPPSSPFFLKGLLCLYPGNIWWFVLQKSTIMINYSCCFCLFLSKLNHDGDMLAIIHYKTFAVCLCLLKPDL